MRNKLCLALSVAALLCMAQPQSTLATIYEVNATGQSEAAAVGNGRMNALRQCLNGMITPEQAKEHAMELRPLFRKLNSLTSVEVLESGLQDNLVAIRANVTVDEEALLAELKAIPDLAGLIKELEPILPTPDIQQPVPGGSGEIAQNNGNDSPTPDVQQPVQGEGGEIAQNNGNDSPVPPVPPADTDVETAIANALAAVHAKAEKVAFSAEEQSLVITGLEYTGPQGNIQRKGRIEQIRLEGFDEKALLESGDEPGDLPRLAEKAVISGWTDSSEENGDKTVLSMESCTVQGWYQRLGVLLKSSSLEDKGRFFEESLNYRLDSAQSENITIRLESSKPGSSPVNITVKSMEEPGGVPAPGADGEPRKTNVLMRDIAFTSGDTSGALEKFTFSGVIIPQPSQMAALWKNISDTGKGNDPETVFRMLSDLYGGKPPFSLVSLENLKVWMSNNDEPSTLENLSLAIDNEPYKLDFSINALRLAPNVLGEYREMVMRHAPEGILLDMQVNGSSSESESDANVSIKLNGLGKLDTGLSMLGDIPALVAKAMKEPGKADELMPQMLSQIKLASIGATYEDSGLAAMILDIFAKQSGMEPANLLPMVSAMVGQLASSENDFYKKLGVMLKEQLANPGTMSVRLAPDTDIDVMTFGMMAAGSPDKLPLEFSSKPGSKSMEEYLK